MLWSVTTDQRIQWGDDTHLILIKAIRANLAVLNSDTKLQDREQGWLRIIEFMEKAGMPPCTLHALQSKWRRIKGRALDNIARYRKQKWNKVKNIMPLSRNDQAVLELINELKEMSKNHTGRRHTVDSHPAAYVSKAC